MGKSVEIFPKSIESASFTPTSKPLHPISNKKVAGNKDKGQNSAFQKLLLQKNIKKVLKNKSRKTLPRKIEPFFPSPAESKPNVRQDEQLNSPFYQPKTNPVGGSAITEIDNNFSSRFKVYQAVPEDDF